MRVQKTATKALPPIRDNGKRQAVEGVRIDEGTPRLLILYRFLSMAWVKTPRGSRSVITMMFPPAS